MSNNTGCLSAASLLGTKQRYLMRPAHWLHFAVVVLLAAGIAPRHATATSVSPIQLEMTSAGPSSRAQVKVTNSNQAPLALEASLKRMELDESGRQSLSEAGAEFLIFPPQAMVAPGVTQVFRVEWVGAPDLSESQSFLLSLAQIPLKNAKGQSTVQVIMSLGVLVNVAPFKGTPQIKLIGTDVEVEKSGKRRPAITVENPSRVHALLRDATIRLSNGSWSQTLSPVDFGQLVGAGLVQPGKRRRFTLPIELPPSVKAVQADIDYRPKLP
jgi:P pilus assembly chaperone PapD